MGFALLFLGTVLWIVFYDITHIIVPFLSERRKSNFMTSGIGMAILFLLLGILSGIIGDPRMASAFVIWTSLCLLPLIKSIVLRRLGQEIPLHLSLVTIPGIVAALLLGVGAFTYLARVH
jgi:hypothetical protein